MRNLDVLAPGETELKDKGVQWFGKVQGVKSRISKRKRVKEGAAMMMRH